MSENSNAPKYRPDIDGLRAVAVLSVVFYHAFPARLTGGFAGVDVFFVISGFLISTIIFKSLDRETFSIANFYSRRIRRIFPALILILIFVLIVGWFCLFPEEYQRLGKHVAASAGFLQNFALWKESGYFDSSSDAKPLLHIWSLGIEEQFYFIWPILLYCAARLGNAVGNGRHKRLFYFLATFSVFVISFVLNLLLVKVDPTKTFYLPQYRFFELSVGGILSWFVLYEPSVVHKGKWAQNALSAVGLLVLAFVFCRFTKATVFPGWNALYPTLATAFVILSGPNAFLNRRLLSTPVLVWFGLISFPLYLWHWPLLSFARIIKGEEPSPRVVLALVVASVLLAWLTLNVVEKRLRFNPSRKVVGSLCALLALVLVLGQHIKDHSGIKNRGIVTRNFVETGFDGGDQGYLVSGCGIDPSRLEKFPESSCRHDSRGEPSVALIGDSKAGAFVGAMVRNSDEATRVLFLGGNGKFGAPTPYSSTNYANDRDPNLPNPNLDSALDAVLANTHIKVVVLYYATRGMFKLKNDKDILDLLTSPNSDFAYARTNKLVQELIDGGKKVVLLVDNPTLPEPTSCIDRNVGLSWIDRWRGGKANPRCSISLDRQLELSKPYREVLLRIEKEHPASVRVFDTLPFLCDMQTRTCSMTLNGRRLYSYSDHLSDYGSGLVAKKLIAYIKDSFIER